MPGSNPASTKRIVTGSYTGNNGASRAITVGFRCSCVLVGGTKPSGGMLNNFAGGMVYEAAALWTTWVKLLADGFQVNQTTLNDNTIVFYYWAIEE